MSNPDAGYWIYSSVEATEPIHITTISWVEVDKNPFSRFLKWLRWRWLNGPPYWKEITGIER